MKSSAFEGHLRPPTLVITFPGKYNVFVDLGRYDQAAELQTFHT